MHISITLNIPGYKPPGNDIVIQVPKDTRIKDVRDEVYDDQDISDEGNVYRLYSQGKRLREDLTLRECGISQQNPVLVLKAMTPQGLGVEAGRKIAEDAGIPGFIGSTGGGLASGIGMGWVKGANLLGAGIDEHDMYRKTADRVANAADRGRELGGAPVAAAFATTRCMADMATNIGRGAVGIATLRGARKKVMGKFKKRSNNDDDDDSDDLEDSEDAEDADGDEDGDDSDY